MAGGLVYEAGTRWKRSWMPWTRGIVVLGLRKNTDSNLELPPIAAIVNKFVEQLDQNRPWAQLLRTLTGGVVEV